MSNCYLFFTFLLIFFPFFSDFDNGPPVPVPRRKKKKKKDTEQNRRLLKKVETTDISNSVNQANDSNPECLHIQNEGGKRSKVEEGLMKGILLEDNNKTGLSKNVNNVNISLVPFKNGTNTIRNVFQSSKLNKLGEEEEEKAEEEEENDAVFNLDDSRTRKIIGNYKNTLYENVLKELKDLFKRNNHQPSARNEMVQESESDSVPVNASVIKQKNSVDYGCEKFSNVDIGDLEKRREKLESQGRDRLRDNRGSNKKVLNLMAPKPYHVFLREYQERREHYNKTDIAPFFNLETVNDEILSKWNCTKNKNKMKKKFNVLDNCLDDIFVDITKHSLDIKHDPVNNSNDDDDDDDDIIIKNVWGNDGGLYKNLPDDKSDRKVKFSEDVEVIANLKSGNGRSEQEDSSDDEVDGVSDKSSGEVGIQIKVNLMFISD